MTGQAETGFGQSRLPALICPPSDLFAIAGGVKIGVPRFAEGNLAPLPEMSQIAR